MNKKLLKKAQRRAHRVALRKAKTKRYDARYVLKLRGLGSKEVPTVKDAQDMPAGMQRQVELAENYAEDHRDDDIRLALDITPPLIDLELDTSDFEDFEQEGPDDDELEAAGNDCGLVCGRVTPCISGEEGNRDVETSADKTEELI
jgi:hypothetical protein